MTLSAAIESACRQNVGKAAIYQGDGTPVLFRSLFLTMLGFAEVLRDRGISQGEKVSVGVTDAISGTLLRLALLRLGAVVLPAALGEDADWRLQGRVHPRLAFVRVPHVGEQNDIAYRRRVSKKHD